MESANPYRENAEALSPVLPISADLYSAMADAVEKRGNPGEKYSSEDLFLLTVEMCQANAAAITRVEALIRDVDVTVPGDRHE